jgi:hypothetical protein
MSETTETTKLITFLDTIGRTILGERVEEKTTADVLTIKNPAVVQVMPNPQSGQLALQILPLFFKEFQADKSEATYWSFQRKLITEATDIAFDFKLDAQYKQIFSNIIIPSTPAPASDAPVIKLFED